MNLTGSQFLHLGLDLSNLGINVIIFWLKVFKLFIPCVLVCSDPSSCLLLLVFLTQDTVLPFQIWSEKKLQLCHVMCYNPRYGSKWSLHYCFFFLRTRPHQHDHVNAGSVRLVKPSLWVLHSVSVWLKWAIFHRPNDEARSSECTLISIKKA